MAKTAVAPVTLHPAKFSDPVIDRIGVEIYKHVEWMGIKRRPIRVLDPFAGVGRVHALARPGEIETVGVEIEAPWAACHRDTICADSIAWMRRYVNAGREPFDVVVTSPVYGNRMSDHHDARDSSERRSYTHDLRTGTGDDGYTLAENNMGKVAWGPVYREFHIEAWRLVAAILKPDGLFVLNVSDFVRNGEVVHAAWWHWGAAMAAGCYEIGRWPVNTHRMRNGANRDARAESEMIYTFGPVIQ